MDQDAWLRFPLSLAHLPDDKRLARSVEPGLHHDAPPRKRGTTGAIPVTEAHEEENEMTRGLPRTAASSPDLPRGAEMRDEAPTV